MNLLCEISSLYTLGRVRGEREREREGGRERKREGLGKWGGRVRR